MPRSQERAAQSTDLKAEASNPSVSPRCSYQSGGTLFPGAGKPEKLRGNSVLHDVRTRIHELFNGLPMISQ
jgi:hypothetical protein